MLAEVNVYLPFQNTTASFAPPEMVLVNEKNNSPDSTGYGRVDYEYLIGKYEVSIGEYTNFLNSVAKDNCYGAWSTGMASALNSAGVNRTGSAGSYTYTAMPVDGRSKPEDAPYINPYDRPITMVNYFQVMRFINWVENGMPTTGVCTSETTEDGTYPLNGQTAGTPPAVNNINPNTGIPPLYALPTENEWYKPAYYGGSGKYWPYATQSDQDPANVLGGNVTNTVIYITFPNNYYAVTQSPTQNVSYNYIVNNDALPNVPGYFGTFHMNGNVWEINDGNRESSQTRPVRGGGKSYMMTTKQ